jgi:hypothetical protein
MAGLRVAAALPILALSSGTGAQTPDPRQSALDDFVAARMVTTKCPSWQLDVAEVRSRFSSLDLKPEDWQDGGPYARFFGDSLSHYSGIRQQKPPTPVNPSNALKRRRDGALQASSWCASALPQRPSPEPSASGV